MAFFTRTNGDLKPVANYDEAEFTNSGADAVTAGKTVQPAGPKLDFFTIDSGLNPTTGAQYRDMLKTIGQLATVHMYHIATADRKLHVAVYPTGAWTSATLLAAINTNVPEVAATSSLVAGASFTN